MEIARVGSDVVWRLAVLLGVLTMLARMLMSRADPSSVPAEPSPVGGREA